MSAPITLRRARLQPVAITRKGLPVHHGSPNLQAERKRQSLSQEQLARSSGISTRTLRSLENGGKTTPRRETVARVIASLGADSATRQAIEDDLQIDTRPRAVPPGAMVAHPADHATMLSRVRVALARYVSLSVRRTAQVHHRAIRIVRSEFTAAALERDVDRAVFVIVHDTVEEMHNVDLVSVHGCSIGAVHRIPDQLMTVVDLVFGRRLAFGEGHVYAIEERYDLSHVGEPDAGDPLRGRILSIGSHRGALLASLTVHFGGRPWPTRCFAVYEPKLAEQAQYEVGEDLSVAAEGSVSRVITNPAAGWHGIAWEW